MHFRCVIGRTEVGLLSSHAGRKGQRSTKLDGMEVDLIRVSYFLFRDGCSVHGVCTRLRIGTCLIADAADALWVAASQRWERDEDSAHARDGES